MRKPNTYTIHYGNKIEPNHTVSRYEKNKIRIHRGDENEKKGEGGMLAVKNVMVDKKKMSENTAYYQ